MILSSVLRFSWVTSLVFLPFFFYGCSRSPALEILEERQGSFASGNYRFIHEHWLQPKIGALFLQEGLERFHKNYKDEWERWRRLCDWTNAQWAPGTPDPYPLCNGIDILKDIRSGKTKGFCAQYAYLFADAMKSLGNYDVRYVELESGDRAFHFTNEVWMGRWQKWVVLDPFFNAYYTGTDGVPLSAFQLHHLLISGKKQEVRIHVISKRDYQPRPDNSIDFYYSFAVSLRNDLAGLNSPLTTEDRLRMFVQYVDPSIRDWKPSSEYEYQSSRKEDFEYACNQVYFRYSLNENDSSIRLKFETRGTIPHFKRFLVSIDDQEWKQSSDEFIWQVGEGEHQLEVVGVNRFNLFSHTASLKVRKRR